VSITTSLLQRQRDKSRLEIPKVKTVHPSISTDLKVVLGKSVFFKQENCISLNLALQLDSKSWMLQTLQAYSTYLKPGDNHPGNFFLAHSPSIPPQ
jgi:hypothetical protein